MKAIHVLKQNDLFLIENTKTQKVFVANDVNGKDRICEHDHDKKKFEKHYKAWDGKDKPCKKCKQMDVGRQGKTKNTLIDSNFTNADPLTQKQWIDNAVAFFRPFFSYDEFVFFILVKNQIYEILNNLQEESELFQPAIDSSKEDFLPYRKKYLEKELFTKILKWGSDILKRSDIFDVLSLYLFLEKKVANEVTKFGLLVDFMTDDDIFSILFYDFNVCTEAQRLQKVLYLRRKKISSILHELMVSYSLTKYKSIANLLKKKTPPYADRIESYFRTKSLLDNLLRMYNNRLPIGIIEGGYYQIDIAFLKLLQKIRESDNLGYDVFHGFLSKNFKDPAKLVHILRFDVNRFGQFIELEEQRQQKEFEFQEPETERFVIDYDLVFIDEDGKTDIAHETKEIYLNIYDVFLRHEYFGKDDGILMSDYYKNTKEYSNITIKVVVS